MAYQEFDGELDAPKYTEFTGELDAAPTKGLLDSANEALDSALTVLPDGIENRINTLRGRAKRESVLEGQTLPDPSFDAAEAQRLSRKSYVDQQATKEAQKNSPSMREDEGASLPMSGRGILGRAADMAESQARQATAGAAQFGADALDVVGADDAARALQTSARGNQRVAKNIDAGNQLRTVANEADGSMGGLEKFADKYAPQVLAQLPQIGLTMISGGITLPAVLSGLGSYADAREQGKSPLEALPYAAAMGGMEAIGEKLGGMGKLADAFEDALAKGFTKDAAVALGKQAMQSGLREVPSEEITYTGQVGVGNIAGINPVNDFGTFAEGAKDTAIVAAGAGGVLGGAGAIASQMAAPKNNQDLVARELAQALEGGSFIPRDIDLATPNPNLTNTEPTRQQAAARITTATTPDEAVAAFTAATHSSVAASPEIAAALDSVEQTAKPFANPVPLATDLLARTEADLATQELTNGTAVTVLPGGADGAGQVPADAGAGVGDAGGIGLQPGLPESVSDNAVLDQSGGVPGGVAASPLNTPVSNGSIPVTYGRGVFQTAKGAAAYIKANKLDGQAEVQDTGSGYAVKPITQGIANGTTQDVRNSVRQTTGGVGAGNQSQNNDAGAVQGVGAGGVGQADRTATQAKFDNWRNTRLNSIADPQARAVEAEHQPDVRFNAPDPTVEADAQRVVAGVSGILSIDPNKIGFFSDDSPTAPNGLAYNGIAWINTKGLNLDATQTGLHEGHHILERIAEAHDRSGLKGTPEQNYRDKTHGLFDGMSDAGKRSYVANFLFKPQLDAMRADLVKKGASRTSIAAQLEAKTQELMKSDTLRSEMAADFVGNRHNDVEFLESVANADPKGFKSIIRNWLNLLQNITQKLLGKGGNREAKAIDGYFVNGVKGAKDTLRTALIELKNRGVKVDDFLADPLLAPDYARGVIAEVAPNPDTETGAQWREMQANEKEQATRGVANKTVQKVFDVLGLKGWSFNLSSGAYQGELNPNILVEAPDSAADEQLDDVANALGYVYDQKAMVSYADDITAGEDLSSFVKVIPPAKMSTKQVNELREWIAKQVPQVDADTMMRGEIVIGNFSAFNDDVETLDDAAFDAAIVSAVESFAWDGDAIHVKDVERYRSKLIWPDKRDDYLQGFQDGNSDSQQVQPGDGRPVLRGAQRSVLAQLTEMGQEAVSLRQQWIDASASGKQRGKERRRVLAEDRARTDGAGAVEYGTRTPNSVAAVGVHFSTAQRASLSSAFYGRGAKGAEAKRLSDPANADIKPRIFFYVDKGNGVTPEAGVGSVRHAVKLNNLYDTKADPLGFIKNTRVGTADERASKWERAIHQAGFDGYLVDNDNPQDFAVLIGKHEVAFNRRFKSVDDFDTATVDDIDELGAFNLDANTEDDIDAAGDVLEAGGSLEDFLATRTATAKAEMQAALQAELDAEMRGPKPQKAVTLEDMKAHGLHPEMAFDEAIGEALEDGGSISFANTDEGKVLGQSYSIRRDSGAWYVRAPGTWSIKNMDRETAIKFAKHMVAARKIQDSGFDIASGYRKGTVIKLVETWRKLAGKPGMFKLPDSGKSQDFAAIAAEMKAFPGYVVSAMGNINNLHINLLRGDGEVFSANLQGFESSLEACTMGLAGSGDLGSKFYAVAGEYARLNGRNFLAADTLSSINTARRTEQALSYALKTGNAGVLLPGIQNRVYGFKKNPRTQEDHAMNTGRLLLASLRNAVEVDPNIRRLRYDPATDTFTDAKGRDASAKVKAFLESPEARAYGMGRTTLARAVVTSQIVSGTLDADKVAEFKEPIAYSRKLGMEPLSEQWGEEGAVVPSLKRYMGDSVMVHEDGTPVVMYHGTAQNIEAFKPKQAGAIFLSFNPNFAEDFANASAEWMQRHFDEVLTPEQVEQAKANAVKTVMADGSMRLSERKAMAAEIKSGKPTGAAQDAMMEAAKDMMPSGENILPLVVRAENPFDFRKPDNREALVAQIMSNAQADGSMGSDGLVQFAGGLLYGDKDVAAILKNGDWTLIEQPETQQAIRDLGHDSFYVMENGQLNLAVYNPNQVKSAVGNNGNYDLEDDRIAYARKLKNKDGTDYDYEKAVAEKHERIRRFDADRDGILAQLDRDAANGREAASVLRLMAVAGFRVGGDPKLSGKHEAFGASTLKPEHVKINGSVVSFDFIGKAGVRQQHSIDDPAIAQDLAKRMDREKLFKVADRTVRDYMDKIIGSKDYKTHDFRTWTATDTARQVVAAHPQPTDAAEFWHVHDLAIAAAASKIGDTTKVAKESYVDPRIFDSIRETSGVQEGQRRGHGKPKANDPAGVSTADAGVLQPEQAAYARSSLDDYLDGRSKSLPLASPQSVLDADIGTAVEAFEMAIENIKAGDRSVLPVPVGRIPHALTMLRVQAQMMRVDTSILYKAFVNPDKHADVMSGVNPDHLIRAMYQPAMILKGDRQGEYELVTSITTPKGPIIVPIMINANGSNHAAIMSMYDKKVSLGGQSILQRIKDGKLLYADPEQAQVAITGRGAVPLVGINSGRTGTYAPPPTKGQTLKEAVTPTGINTWEAQFSDARPIEVQGVIVDNSESNVKPLNPYYAGWRDARTLIMDGIASKRVKSDVDLVKWIGNNYKAANSKDGWEDAPAFSRALQGRSFTLPSETKTSQARRILQDFFLPVLEVQKALVAQGGTVGEAQDVYRAEERSHGRVEEAIKDFERKVFVPLVEKASDKATGEINMDELALYAYAMHAPERNAHIASIDRKLQDGGSGMTNQEAADIIAAFTAEGKLAKLEDLHNDLMAITATTRRTLLEEGLITQAHYDAMEAQYAHYIPLRGFAQMDEDDKPTPRGRGGKGFNVRGEETMRALGRTSMAGDLIENVVADYEKALVRGERNTVAKVFLDMVLTNPDPGLWEIDAEKTRKSFDKASGRVARNTTIDTGEDTIAVKVDGKVVYIKVHDKRFLRAMKFSFKDDTGAVTSFLMNTVGIYSTLMRNTLTRFNPAFAGVNAVRDFGMGSVAMVDTLGFKGQAKFTKHYSGALAASFRNEVDAMSGASAEWQKWFEEYRAAGATTGGYYARSVDDIKGDIRDIMLINGAAPKGKLEYLKASRGYGAMKRAGHLLEMLGSTSENAARLAAYRTAREMGKTPAEAASIAKNLTTNFNRKGEWGQAINTLYVFYNAAVQGSHRTLVALSNPKVQGMMAGAAAAGFMMALANASNGGDDDDGQAYWDKIADFEKERNFIIMLPPGIKVDGVETVGKHGRYIKIPMAYGFNIFPMLGQQLADVYRHSKDETRGIGPGKAALNMANAVLGSFNPFGGSIDPASATSVGMAVAPSIADLFIQMGAGVNAFDRPTAPYKSEMDTRLDSENVNPRQAGGWAHQMARGLNKVSGGNQVEAGAIDVNPGTIENLWRNATGGTGVFLSDVFANIPMKALTPESDLTAKDIPLLRNFYGSVDETNNASLFYERRKAINEAAATQKRYDHADMERPADKDFEALVDLSRSAARYTKQLSRMRREEIEIALDETATRAEKAARTKELKRERDETIMEFNTEFMEVMREKRDVGYGKK